MSRGASCTICAFAVYRVPVHAYAPINFHFDSNTWCRACESEIWPEIIADCRFAYISNVLRFVRRSRNLSRFTVVCHLLWMRVGGDCSHSQCHPTQMHTTRILAALQTKYPICDKSHNLRLTSIVSVFFSNGKNSTDNFSCFSGFLHHLLRFFDSKHPVYLMNCAQNTKLFGWLKFFFCVRWQNFFPSSISSRPRFLTSITMSTPMHTPNRSESIPSPLQANWAPFHRSLVVISLFFSKSLIIYFRTPISRVHSIVQYNCPWEITNQRGQANEGGTCVDGWQRFLVGLTCTFYSAKRLPTIHPHATCLTLAIAWCNKDDGILFAKNV